MASNRSIEPGDRFRDLQMKSFEQSRLEWVVEGFSTGGDKIPYVHLVCGSDSTERKTLSASILEDRRRFVRMEEETG